MLDTFDQGFTVVAFSLYETLLLKAWFPYDRKTRRRRGRLVDKSGTVALNGAIF